MKAPPTAPSLAPGEGENAASFWGALQILAEARQLIESNRRPDAEDLCRKVLRAQPRHPDALHMLGLLLLGRGRGDLSVTLLRRAIAVNPGVAAYHVDLGHALRSQGMTEEALASYQHAYALEPDPGLRVNMALLQPVIPGSRSEIIASRSRLASETNAILETENIALDDPMRQVGMTVFHLAYHGFSDRSLQEKIAQFYLTVSPGLAWTAAHCRPGLRPETQDGRLRIGIVSPYFRYHTIAKVTRGLIEHLDRARFHVTVFYLGTSDDWTTRIVESADHALRLTGSLAEMREAIAGEEVDVLFYPEIGMHAATYFLAFARLAPVQCVTWGHPVTTGIPNVDYYLSSADLEQEGSEAEYSERLISLNHLPTYYYHPPLATNRRDRAWFGFDPSTRLYICPQLLFKLHPDFDPILGDILRRDPRGVLVFLEGAKDEESHRQRLFRERFDRANPDVANRLVFRPFLDPDEFASLIEIADVLLDPPYFGGGNTSLEAFAIGTPIVTWPGPFARGRTTYACYRTMDILDGIVASLDDYAERAVKIATDRMLRSDIRERILARNAALYEQIDSVREFERFFTESVANHRHALTVT